MRHRTKLTLWGVFFCIYALLKLTGCATYRVSSDYKTNELKATTPLRNQSECQRLHDKAVASGVDAQIEGCI